MARNVEVKARIVDLRACEALAREMADSGPEDLRQTDEYFRVPDGRLKLRSNEDGDSELIRYSRPNVEGPTLAEYSRVPVHDAPAMAQLLAETLGRSVTVRKRRRVYRVGRSRIHLDEVEGLGSFIEIEVVLEEGEDEVTGHVEMERLLDALHVVPRDYVARGYADLLLDMAEPGPDD